MVDLDVYGDRLIVLEAITTSDWHTRRQPLTPTNHRTQRSISVRSDDLVEPPKHSTPELKNLFKQETATVQDENNVAHGAGLQTGMSLQPEQRFPDPFSKSRNQLSMFTPDRQPASPNSTTTSKPQSHLSLGDGEQREQSDFQLQALLKDATPEMLKSSVEEGVKLLDRLKVPMVTKMSDSPDAEQWVQQIENLQRQAVKTKTIIGVVGNTGAGKSSVINALLDQERLVPTNCMRACTAVVTEISYNYEETPYRAEVEFIKLEDWEKELKTLFQDLLDGNGEVSRDCTNADSDAGIAYANIKAVYPKKTREDIAKSSIQKMLHDVEHILGQTRNIQESDPYVFYKRLQVFVDSKEKSTGGQGKEKKKAPKEMEFWPLIRVVRLYVKPLALSTGAVIVDLPGVHDSNAARAAVAEGYLKKTTGLWIVAPINRAVDDKAAKTLLGESFKRQLKMDGGFGSVTFICSKTDDISLTEAQESLNLEEELGKSWEKLDALSKRKKALKSDLEEFKENKSLYLDAINDVDEEIETWEGLKDDLVGGKTVRAPLDKAEGKKRKRSVSMKNRATRKRTSRTRKKTPPHTKILTEAEITTKLSELRATRRESRHAKVELEERLRSVRCEIENVETTKENIEAEISAVCIAGRNRYSKGAIQQDYAAGIKELDQELAAEDDEENFNPDAEFRDYDEVASLSLWASNDGTGANMTTEQKTREEKYMSQSIRKLEFNLDKAVKESCKELTEEFSESIFDKYETAISNATIEATTTSNRWGAPINRGDRSAGGFHWSTYKAICRRDGVYTNAQGPHNFNDQLVSPMIKVVTPGWEKTFSRRLPTVMAGFVRNASKFLKEFHREVDDRVRKIGVGIARLGMLSQQLPIYDNIFKDISASLCGNVNNGQKEINRRFCPIIQTAMGPAYIACVDECGKGSFARMKGHMNDHVEMERYKMFQKTAEDIKSQLLQLVNEQQEFLSDRVDNVFILVRRDYRTALGIDQSSQEQLIPKTQRLMRQDVLAIIEGVEKTFRRIAGLEEVKEEGEESGRDDVVETTDDKAVEQAKDQTHFKADPDEPPKDLQALSDPVEAPKATGANGNQVGSSELAENDDVLPGLFESPTGGLITQTINQTGTRTLTASNLRKRMADLGLRLSG
ncbi:MAG: hypothetical protein Q9167_002583 [Letrouitia subvulpina]